MRFLQVQESFDFRLVRAGRGRGVKIPRPQVLRPLEGWKFFQKRLGNAVFENTNRLPGAGGWRYIYMQVAVVCLSVYVQQQELVPRADLASQLLRASLNAIYQENFPPIACAEQNMVVKH